MTTRLLIQADSASMAINLPALSQMTITEFYEFCQANPELRIERSAGGEVVIMSPAFPDTGNRNLNLAVQLGTWAEKDGTGIGFDLVPGSHYRMVPPARRMSLGLKPIAGTH